MIKVLLTDDQRIFLDGMKAILEKFSDIEVVGEALDGESALKILETTTVNVVVLDIDMPNGIDGIEATKIIKEKYKNVNVLVLSMYGKKEFIIKLMRYGASGYILKNMSSEELYMAIRNVAAGRTHYGLEVMDYAVSTTNPIKELEEPISLTETEITIMKKSAEGLSAKEIAQVLGRAKTTIDKHRQNIYNKLEFNNLAQLTRYAIRHGYVQA